LNNPIVQRELIGMLRTWRALIIQVALFLALSILVLMRWPSGDFASEFQAREVFSVFGYGLMVALIMLAPVFPAISIVREKRQGTLILLMTSPMSRWKLLTGKFVGSLGFVMLLIALSLPPAAACYAIGGIDLGGQFVMTYLVLLALAVQYTALGLLVSTYANTTDAAMRITFGLVLVLAVLTLLPKMFLQGNDSESMAMSVQSAPVVGAAIAQLIRLLAAMGVPVEVVVDWLRCLSPIAAMQEVLGHAGVGAAGLQGIGHVAIRYIILAVVTGVGFAAWTGMRLDLRLFDKPRPIGTVTDDRSSSARMFRRLMYLWFFDPQRRSELIGARWLPMLVTFTGFVIAVGATMWAVSQEMVLVASLLAMAAVAMFLSFLSLLALINPVMVKEFRTRRFGRGHWMMRLIAACLIVSLALAYISSSGTIRWGASLIGAILVIFQMGLVVLVTPALASGLISAERESGGWQLLRMTPLSALSIVAGKLASVMFTLSLILAATLPSYAVLLYIDTDNQKARVPRVLLTLVITAVFALLTSGAISSLCKKTAVATTTAYVFLLTLCAGTMLAWLGLNNPFSLETVAAVLTVNPVAAALELIETPNFENLNLVPRTWYVMLVGCAVSVVVLVLRTWQLTRPT